MRSIALPSGTILLLTTLVLGLPTLAAASGNPPNQPEPEGLPRLTETAAATTITLQAAEAVPIRDIYRAIGEQAGIEVTFDRRLRDFELAIGLQGLRLHAALDRTSKAAGHFWRATDPSGIVVVDDTPQNRRSYELQVVRTFDLAHVRPADMMTVLRSVISLKNVAVEREARTLTMRDTAAKVALASRIIERLDQPRQQITLDLALLRVPRDAFRDLRAQASDNRLQLSADQHQRLRSQGQVVAEPTLSIMGGDSARHESVERRRGADGETVYFNLALDFEARSQAGSDGVSLAVRTTAKLVGTEGPVSTRESTSTIAVGSAEAVAFFDWMPVADDEMSVLVIRPTIAERPTGTHSLQAGIVIGTESNIQMPGHP